MDEFEKILTRSACVLILKICMATLVAACCSGCLDGASPAVAAPAAVITPADVDATIHKFDAETFQPALPDDFKKPDGAVADTVTLPIITVYGPPKCGPCAKAVKELNETKRYDACHEDQIPQRVKDVADQWNQGNYPIAFFNDRKGDERFVVWRGLKDFETRYNRTMNPKKQQASAAPPLNFRVTNGPHWTHPGSIASHLRDTHGVNPSGMTQQEMLSLHDALHEGRVTRSSVRSKSYAMQTCPNCPTQRRRP